MVQLGLCEDYPEASTSFGEVRRDMELLRRCGASLLRISVPWCDVEPLPRQYRWEFLDRFVDLAAGEYGLTLLPYMCYTPRWATRTEAEDFWRHPPKGCDAFARFMSALAERYCGRIGFWEIWNEPDNADFWTGTAADYSALLKAGSGAVRAADPQAKVVCGGLAGNTAWLASLFRGHEVSASIDIVNLHSYFETWCDHPAEQVGDYVRHVSDILCRHGHNQPIWMAETGYSTYRDGSRVSDQCSAYYDYEHTPAYQATHLVRTMACILATERVDAVAWYELRDLPAGAPIIGEVNNRHLGIADATLAEKPALEAFLLVRRLLGLPHRCIDDQILVSRALSSDAEIHCFERLEGGIVIFAWLRTRICGRAPLPPDGQAVDERREVVELTLPCSASEAFTYSAEGALRRRELLSVQPGGTKLRLNLRGGDLSAVEITPAHGGARVVAARAA